jgi:hypothetical protein
MTTTCGACRFFELPAEDDVRRLTLQGYRVPEGVGHCSWTPREVLVLPKAFTMQIRPMHKDDAEECARFLAVEGEEGPEDDGAPAHRPGPAGDVEDLVS